jgi:hypothetical protein
MAKLRRTINTLLGPALGSIMGGAVAAVLLYEPPPPIELPFTAAVSAAPR